MSPRCPNCDTQLTQEDFSEVLDLFTCPKCGMQAAEVETREVEVDGGEV